MSDTGSMVTFTDEAATPFIDALMAMDGVRSCPACDGDGYLDVMDPDHYGAVIGSRECPRCGGEGVLTTPYDDEAYLASIPVDDAGEVR